MKMRGVAAVAAFVVVAGCPPPPGPSYPEPYEPYGPVKAVTPAEPTSVDPTQAGVVVTRTIDFAFDGGRLEFEMRRDGDRVIEVARNHYAVPLVVQWSLDRLENLSPIDPPYGVVVLPAAPVIDWQRPGGRVDRARDPRSPRGVSPRHPVPRAVRQSGRAPHAVRVSPALPRR